MARRVISNLQPAEAMVGAIAAARLAGPGLPSLAVTAMRSRRFRNMSRIVMFGV
jgi:hypothetical protein